MKTILFILCFIYNSLSSSPSPYIKSLKEIKKEQPKEIKKEIQKEQPNEPISSQTVKCNKYNQFQCISHLHGIQCIPSKQRCDGLYQCKDQSDERHCYLSYAHGFTAKCQNSHGSYAPYALSDVFDNKLDAGEISIAPNDYLQCDITLNNITNV